jgi:signal transduction histidine kinase
MRLSVFIRTNADRILREWEDFVKTHSAAAVLPRWVLRAHAAAILQLIAEGIERPQLATEQESKAKGERALSPVERVAALHVDLRIESGFDLVQIMAEYRVLRACVLRLWRESDPDGFAQGAEDITRFSEAVDQGLAETVPIYEQREANYRDRFLGILGHDLRNPLNSISMGATSLARSEGLTDKQRETISRILSSARRLDHMVNDILDFARLRLGSPMPIAPARVNLGTLVREVADEVRSINPGLSVDLDANCDLTGDWDAERLKQVVSNLLINAIQHGTGKTIRLKAESDEQSVLLEVTNEGTPIPKELLGTIFDPLVHGKRSDQNRTGLGLGLFIVSEIVYAHKGTVAVTSSEEAGTTFSVRLPRHLP